MAAVDRPQPGYAELLAGSPEHTGRGALPEHSSRGALSDAPAASTREAPDVLEEPVGTDVVPPPGQSARDWWTWELVNSAHSMETSKDMQVPFGKHLWVSRVEHWRHSYPTSFRHFFTSAEGAEWSVFAMVLCCFIGLQWFLMDWPSTRKHHWTALIIWLAAGGIYNLVIWDRLGAQQGQMWLCGYWQELVFSMENVFIFHTIVQAFKTPRKMAQKALFIVVVCQVLFQMVFFMGLANWLQSLKVLPYILGIWLLYLGISTLRGQDDHGQSDVDLQDLNTYKVFRVCLGERLLTRYHESSSILLRHAGLVKVSLLGPAVLCLLVADFAMEIDVTLTKIEGMENHFVAFTSSAAAAFAMPELFFVAGDLFQRYALLHYGIAFVLIYFAAQLLLHEVVHVPDMIGILVILVVMGMCIAASRYLESKDPKYLGRSSSVGEDFETDCGKDTRLPVSLNGSVGGDAYEGVRRLKGWGDDESQGKRAQSEVPQTADVDRAL